MSEELAISLRGVSKCFKRYDRPVDRLKELLIPGKSRAKEFWALRDIDLDVPKGQTLGIVGRNGSGKSTLLQIIAGTLTPTTGTVQVNGRVSALLELGSGFNPEFTGRQNVFFNGQLLGLTKVEVEERFDEIAAFADIGDFIDQPVKTYSSGMAVRLAFAVAVHVDPEIFIVDEALAVGDLKFQLKCFEKFRQLKKSQKTIIFVSHDLNSVRRYCDYSILLDQGNLVGKNTPNVIVNQYTKLLSLDELDTTSKIEVSNESIVQNIQNMSSNSLNSEYRYGKNEYGEILKITVIDANGIEINPVCIAPWTRLTFKLKFIAYVRIDSPILAMTVKDHKGEEIYVTNTNLQNIKISPILPQQSFEVSFEQFLCLCPGDYLISFGFVCFEYNELVPIDRRYDAINVKILGEHTDHSFGLVNLKSKIDLHQVLEPLAISSKSNRSI